MPLSMLIFAILLLFAMLMPCFRLPRAALYADARRYEQLTTRRHVGAVE